MEQPRCVLLPAVVGLATGPELLPPGTTPDQALPQGRRFESALGDGARLLWQEDGSVGWQHNPVASSLSRLQVCGDAVLVLPAHPEAAAGLQDRVASLAAKHTAGSPPRRHSSKRPSVDSPTDQQQLLQRLLRQPAVEASTPGDLRLTQRVPAEVVQPAAPGTPRLGEVAGPSSCSSSSIGMTDGQPLAATAAAAPHEQRGQLEREAACQRRQQRQQGQQAVHEVRVFECEPRQALLWSIAGRATSLSWQSGGTAVAAGAAGGWTTLAAAPEHDNVGRASAAAASSTPPAASPLQAAPSPDLERPLAAAKPPQPAAKQRSNRSSLERSPWADLQPEVLGMILAQAGHGAEIAKTASQVCRSWRQGLAAERGALQQLRFATLRWLGDGAAGCDSCSPGSSVAGRSGRCGCDAGALASSSSSRRSSSGGSLGQAHIQLPWLVQVAVKAGNLAATVAAARFLEGTLWALQAHHASEKQAQQSGGDEWAPAREAASWRGHAGRAGHAGHEADLARLWARAAKLGHPEGQWKIGYAHYKGLLGLPRDGEEALLWLNRAARQLSEGLGEDAGSGNGSSAAGASSRSGSAPASGVCVVLGAGRVLPPLLSASACRHILAQAAHILGYLHLDGEGTKADVAAAIRCFRLAERHGCRDAGRVLGSLFNTGQYA